MNEENLENIANNSIMMIRHKIVFVGDVSVGKTSVMCRFTENKFKENYDPTIGVDFYSKKINFRDNSLKLQIWDSAGQERYKSLIPSYVKGASIICIVFDLNKKESFDNIPTWINFIKDVKIEDAIIALCGNKIDLERNVSNTDPEKLAQKEKLLYFEISAKTGQNINKMFYSSIANLQFFETYELTKDQIIDELEISNKDINVSDSIIDARSSNRLNLVDKTNDNINLAKENQCKC